MTGQANWPNTSLSFHLVPTEPGKLDVLQDIQNSASVSLPVGSHPSTHPLAKAPVSAKRLTRGASLRLAPAPARRVRVRERRARAGPARLVLREGQGAAGALQVRTTCHQWLGGSDGQVGETNMPGFCHACACDGQVHGAAAGGHAQGERARGRAQVVRLRQPRTSSESSIEQAIDAHLLHTTKHEPLTQAGCLPDCLLQVYYQATDVALEEAVKNCPWCTHVIVTNRSVAPQPLPPSSPTL